MSSSRHPHPSPLAWMDQAACAGKGPDIWHPGRGETVAEAKATCARCPVREECLQYALEQADQVGIWGGLSARERIEMDRGRYVCPECPRRFATAQGRANHRRQRHEKGPTEHGTKSEYNAGCRCGDCRDANNADARERRARAS